MNPKAYLTNIGVDLKSYSATHSFDEVTQTINFGGTPEELSSRDGIKRDAVCMRYTPGTFDVLVGSNKPSEWNASIEFLLYVETAGGKTDRVYGYNRLLDIFGICVDWQDQVDAAADIHADMSDFYITQNGTILDDRPKYFAMKLTFNSTICL